MLKFTAAVLVTIFMPLSMYTIALALERRTILAGCIAVICSGVYAVSLLQLLILA